MAKATVTVTVYGKTIRGGYGEVISAEEYEEKVSARAKELYEDQGEFYDWLEDTFSAGEIWDMTEEVRKSVKERDFKDKCLGWALTEMESDYEEFEITTKVDYLCDCHNN